MFSVFALALGGSGCVLSVVGLFAWVLRRNLRSLRRLGPALASQLGAQRFAEPSSVSTSAWFGGEYEGVTYAFAFVMHKRVRSTTHAWDESVPTLRLVVPVHGEGPIDIHRSWNAAEPPDDLVASTLRCEGAERLDANARGALVALFASAGPARLKDRATMPPRRVPASLPLGDGWLLWHEAPGVAFSREDIGRRLRAMLETARAIEAGTL